MQKKAVEGQVVCKGGLSRHVFYNEFCYTWVSKTSLVQKKAKGANSCAEGGSPGMCFTMLSLLNLSVICIAGAKEG